MPMQYKLNEDGSIITNDKGFPIIVNDDGKEQAIDALDLVKRVPELKQEAAEYRIKMKTLKEQVESFEGVDPKEAKKAIETVNQLSIGDLKKKEDIDALKADIESSWESKISKLKADQNNVEVELKTTIERLNKDLHRSEIAGQFKVSPYFSGKNPVTNMFPEAAELYFGKHFKIEKDESTGRNIIVGYNRDGKQILSQERPGNLANFDECISVLIEDDPQKGSILRPSSGSGAAGSGVQSKGNIIDVNDKEAILSNVAEIASGKKIVNMS